MTDEQIPPGEHRRGEAAAWHATWHGQAVMQAPNPIFMTAADGTLRAWNPACERLMAGGGLSGRPVTDLLRRADGTAVAPLLARAARGEAVGGVELYCACGDGTQRVLLAWFYPAGDGAAAEPGVLCFAIDVTDRIRFEAELLAAKEAAEAAVQLKSTILNNLSHEIRTPLTAILGFAELLFEEVPDPYREFVHLIRSSGKRLMGTLVAVLELARLESGDVRFEAEEMDLNEEAREAVRMFVPLAESKGLHLDLACPEVPLPVRMDRIALNRIFSNLISNAIKFTPDGFVRVEVVPEGKEAVLRVSDTGIGMSDAFLPHLFQEFKQESEGLGRRHEGAGLGLAITKRLVEQLGGSIVVESVKGQGSTFTVRLPRHRAA